MRKRLLTFALVATMLASMSVTGLAESITGTDKFSGDAFTKDENSTSYEKTPDAGKTQFDVTFTDNINSGISDTKIYYVEVAWKMTPGGYTASTLFEWNPETLKYSKNVTPSQNVISTDSLANITITNRSNAKVNYEVSYVTATEAEKNISYETKTDNDKTGTIESADYVNNSFINDIEKTGVEKKASYSSKIGITNEYQAYLKNNNIAKTNFSLGTYTVTISKPSGN